MNNQNRKHWVTEQIKKKHMPRRNNIGWIKIKYTRISYLSAKNNKLVQITKNKVSKTTCRVVGGYEKLR